MSDLTEIDDGALATFLVGHTEEEITENKFVLSQSSGVFETMLCGELQEKCNIKVPDIEPDVFRTMLRFINGEKVTFTNMDHAAKVCYAADKYDLPELKRECAEYIFPCSIDDVFIALDCGVLYNIDFLKDAAMKIIQKNTYKVLTSKQFLTLSRVALKEILQEDYLDVNSEIELFAAVMNWAKYQCSEAGKSCERKNIRDVLGDVIQHIRFLTMNRGEIINNGKLVLTSCEMKMLLQCINKEDDLQLIESLCCNTEKRKQVKIKLPTAKLIYKARLYEEDGESQIVKSNNIKTQPLSHRITNSIELYSVTITSRCSLYKNSDRMYFEDLAVHLKQQTDDKIIASGSYMGKVEYDTELRIPMVAPDGSFPKLYSMYNSSSNKYYLQTSFKTKDIYYYTLKMCHFSSVFTCMENSFSNVVGVEYFY